MFLQLHNLFLILFLRLLKVGDHLAWRSLLGRCQVAEIKVFKPVLQGVDSFLQIYLMFHIIEGKDMQHLCKMVKNNINVSHDEFALRYLELILLGSKGDGVAFCAEFIAKISNTAGRNRGILHCNLVLFCHRYKGIQNIGFSFSCVRDSPSVYDIGDPLVILKYPKSLLGHQY